MTGKPCACEGCRGREAKKAQECAEEAAATREAEAFFDGIMHGIDAFWRLSHVGLRRL